MLHELLAYFAGSLMLFALSAQGLFIAVSVVAFLSAAAIWWACGAFGRLWYVKFKRRPMHWFLTFVASTGTFLFVFLFAASAFAPQITMVSALVWRTQLSFDTFWGEKVFEECYDSVKSAGYENEATFPALGEGPIPLTHDESRRILAAIEAEAAHEHFRAHRPLLSRAFWQDPSHGEEKIYRHMLAHFSGNAGESTGKSADAILVDIAETLPYAEEFLSELDKAASADGLLAFFLRGVGITSGLENRMSRFDNTIEKIEASEAEGRGSTTNASMHHAILANEILMEAIVEADRIKTILVLSLIGLLLLFLLIPFGTIAIAARREADLSQNQPVQY